MTVNDVVTLDMLAELIAEPTNSRGYAKEIIAEFVADNDEPAWIDLSTLPFAIQRKLKCSALKQTFLNNLPPKNEKAPDSWSKVVVRTPLVTQEDGTKQMHCWLMHIDRVAKMQADAAAAAQNGKK